MNPTIWGTEEGTNLREAQKGGSRPIPLWALLEGNLVRRALYHIWLSRQIVRMLDPSDASLVNADQYPSKFRAEDD